MCEEKINLFNFIKKFRQSLYFLKKRKNNLLRYFYNYVPKPMPNNSIIFSSKKSNIFFGYYDISPFHDKKNIVLGMKYGSKKSKNIESGYVGYFDLDTKKFIRVAPSNCWSWQQGCRLQWYPNNSSNLIIYNYYDDNKYKSIIIDIITKKIVKSIEKPVYCISNDGSWGLTLNFSRLGRLRPGYGYSNIIDSTKNVNCPDDDGIWSINFNNNECKLLYATSSLAKINNDPTMINAEHYINHLLFNPNSNEFVFFHIWQNGNKRSIRLIKSDIFCSSFEILIVPDYLVSHFNWLSYDEMILYLGKGPGGKGYYRMNIRQKKLNKIEGMYHDYDGHPTKSSNNKFIITDTVSNKYSYRELLYYNINNNKTTKIADYYSPYKDMLENRCDLHPRLSNDSSYICTDFFYQGKRAMSVVPINHIK